MNRLVRLRDIDGQPIWFNPDHIVAVTGGPEPDLSVILIADTPPLPVRGTVEETVNAVTGTLSLAATPVSPRSSLTRPN